MRSTTRAGRPSPAAAPASGAVTGAASARSGGASGTGRARPGERARAARTLAPRAAGPRRSPHRAARSPRPRSGSAAAGSPRCPARLATAPVSSMRSSSRAAGIGARPVELGRADRLLDHPLQLLQDRGRSAPAPGRGRNRRARRRSRNRHRWRRRSRRRTVSDAPLAQLDEEAAAHPVAQDRAEQVERPAIRMVAGHAGHADAQVPLREAAEGDPHRAGWRRLGRLERAASSWVGHRCRPIGLEPARAPSRSTCVMLDGSGRGEHEVRRPIPALPVLDHGVVAGPSHAARRPGDLAAERDGCRRAARRRG